MSWIAKLIFPWLLKQAMKLGARAFGRIDPRTHAIKSRRWMWQHVWLPMRLKIWASPTKFDDPLAEFLWVNQACCLDDGSALKKIVTIQQYIAGGDSADAIIQLKMLRTMLGLDEQ